jgi:hypothetical protein
VLLQAQIQELDARQRQLGSMQPIPDVTGPDQPQFPQDQPQGFSYPPEQQAPEFAPEPEGASYDGAQFGDGGIDPTGGDFPPGQPPMEGN